MTLYCKYTWALTFEKKIWSQDATARCRAGEGGAGGAGGGKVGGERAGGAAGGAVRDAGASSQKCPDTWERDSWDRDSDTEICSICLDNEANGYGFEKVLRMYIRRNKTCV